MVHYPRPKFITKTALRNSNPFVWSVRDKADDAAADVATCLRCAQTIAKQKDRCNKDPNRRCKHCQDGNRGGCALVPVELNGRVNRLYELHDRYTAAVTAATTPRTDAQVQATGVKLARAQRTFNLELANRRRSAARAGVPLGTATQNPTTTPQYLSLVLVEQRRMATALESIASIGRTLMNNLGNDGDSSSSSSGDGDDGAAGA